LVNQLVLVKTEDQAFKLEQALFGRMSELDAHLKVLAELQPPTLTDLDPRLRRMFLAEGDVYRIEVEPVEGVTASGLALALRANGITVASPYLERLENQSSVLRGAFAVFGVSFLGAMPLLFVARRRPIAAVQSFCIIMLTLVAVMFAIVAAQVTIHEQLLLLLVPVLALLWTHVGNASIPARLGLYPINGLSELRELEWLLPMVMICVALVAVVLNSFTIALPFAFAAALTLMVNALMEVLAVNRYASGE
jgi:hypothetical protein